MNGPLFVRSTRIAFWAALLFAYICAVIPGGPEIGNSDKNGHVLAFLTLAFLARLGWGPRRSIHIVIALLLFGIFIELSQATPMVHRDADVWDVVADTFGIVIGFVLAVIFGWFGVGAGSGRSPGR